MKSGLYLAFKTECSKNNMQPLFCLIITVGTIFLISCDRGNYARVAIRASDSADLSTQLDEIQQAFNGMPGATLGAKAEVLEVVVAMQKGLMYANLEVPPVVAANLTQKQYDQLDEHIDIALKQSLDGYSVPQLISLHKEVMATGRGGREFADFFTAVKEAAIKDLMSKQKR
jgi:hypothetical protein